MSFSKYVYGYMALQLLNLAAVNVIAAPNVLHGRAPTPTPAPTPAPTPSLGLEKRFPGVAEDQSPNLQKRGFWINHLPFLWDCSIYTSLTTTNFYGEMSTQTLPLGSTSCRCAGDTRVAIETATSGPCTTIKCHGGQVPMVSFVGPSTCTPQPKGSLEKFYWNIIGVQYKLASNVTTAAAPSKRAALPQETGSPNANDNDDIGPGVLYDPSGAQSDDSDLGSGVLSDIPGPTGSSSSDDNSGDDSIFQDANSELNSLFGSSSTPGSQGKHSPSGIRNEATGTSETASSTSYSTSAAGSSSSPSTDNIIPMPTTGMPPPAATSQGASSQTVSSALAPGAQDLKAQGVVVGLLAGVVAMFMM